jgi:hypothetical protein
VKEPLITPKLRVDDLKLIVIPLLVEDILYPASCPSLKIDLMQVGAIPANKCSVCYTSMSAVIMMAIDTIFVVWITD